MSGVKSETRQSAAVHNIEPGAQFNRSEISTDHDCDLGNQMLAKFYVKMQLFSEVAKSEHSDCTLLGSCDKIKTHMRCHVPLL